MSAYYDLFEKPDVRQTGEQQPLYARLVPKGTIERKEFINRVHLFTGISRSLLEGAMAGFMDELRDCLANGWTVELGELGYFTPSLNCRREAMEKKELRSASVTLRGLNFRLGKGFYNELNEKIHLERSPQSATASAVALPPEERLRLLEAYLSFHNSCPVCPAGRSQREASRHRFERIYRGRGADALWSGKECGVCKGAFQALILYY